MEILITTVIIGVLAGIAVPSYVGASRKSEQMEGLHKLEATRDALSRYYAVNGTYVGALMYTFGGIAPNNLDYNPNNVNPGETSLFNYSFSAGPTQNSYTLQALRLTRPGDVPALCGGPAASTITITDNGVITKTGDYA